MPKHHSQSAKAMGQLQEGLSLSRSAAKTGRRIMRADHRSIEISDAGGAQARSKLRLMRARLDSRQLADVGIKVARQGVLHKHAELPAKVRNLEKLSRNLENKPGNTPHLVTETTMLTNEGKAV